MAPALARDVLHGGLGRGDAFDGVFYRLGITTFGYAHDAGDDGDAYSGTLTLFTPFKRRLEARSDVPVVVSSKGRRNTCHTSFGDLSLGPRYGEDGAHGVLERQLPALHGILSFSAVRALSPREVTGRSLRSCVPERS